MPSPQVTNGTIIFRQWDRASGLTETTQTFTSLDELYALCLSIKDPEIIDRIVIEGQDGQMLKRVIAFEFQSITISSQKPSE
jgi:hypothetical protein